MERRFVCQGCERECVFYPRWAEWETSLRCPRDNRMYSERELIDKAAELLKSPVGLLMDESRIPGPGQDSDIPVLYYDSRIEGNQEEGEDRRGKGGGGSGVSFEESASRSTSHPSPPKLENYDESQTDSRLNP